MIWRRQVLDTVFNENFSLTVAGEREERGSWISFAAKVEV